MVSCSNLQAGWFSAYRHLADRDDLDLVLHLGDYVYEYAPGEYGYGQSNQDIRKHVPAREMVSLADYRKRHAQYKRDPDLMRLHAKYPFVCTWDDHETTNDAWRKGAENHNEGEGDYGKRKAVARRAYDEWMPVRMSGTAKLNDGTRLFRRLRFGQLAELSMLDLRTYRSQQVAAAARPRRRRPEPHDHRRQPDGVAQGVAGRRPGAVEAGRQPGDDRSGADPRGLRRRGRQDRRHPAARRTGRRTTSTSGTATPPTAARSSSTSGTTAVNNAVFLTGDIHSGWACDLPFDAESYAGGSPLGTSLGTEFVCSSVTSNNLKDITGDPSGVTSTAVEEGVKTLNSHVKYLNFDDHGYSVVDITRERIHVDWFIISDRADKQATVQRDVSYVTRVNSNRVEKVDEGIG